MEMFYILIVVVVAQLYEFVKISNTVLYTQKGEFYYMQIIPQKTYT